MKRMRLACLSLIALLASAGSLQAQASWNYLVVDGRGMTHYWLPAGRSSENPAWTRIQHRVELAQPLVAGGMTYLSMLYVMEIDCPANRYREVGLRGYTGSNLSGTYVDAPPRSEWHYVEAGTVPSVLAPAACAAG